MLLFFIIDIPYKASSKIVHTNKLIKTREHSYKVTKSPHILLLLLLLPLTKVAFVTRNCYLCILTSTLPLHKISILRIN